MKRRSLMAGRNLEFMQARTPDEYRRTMVAAAGDLGFGLFGASVILQHSARVTEFLSIHNAPAGYESIFKDPMLSKWDPVAQHCKRSAEPIFWNQDTYVSDGVGDTWDSQARFGYRTEICMASHMPLGRHFMFGLDSDRPLPKGRTLAHVTSQFDILFAHAQEAAFRVLAPEAQPAAAGQPLNPFELEVLRWAMDGQSPSETADLMRLSEEHVRIHLQNAVLKLECKTKHQAVIRALKARLLM